MIVHFVFFHRCLAKARGIHQAVAADSFAARSSRMIATSGFVGPNSYFVLTDSGSAPFDFVTGTAVVAVDSVEKIGFAYFSGPGLVHPFVVATVGLSGLGSS